MHYFLGMEVWQVDEELFVYQGKYSNDTLNKFHVERSKPMEIPLARNWRKEDATSGEVGGYYLQVVCGFTYVFGEHMTRHMFCSQPT